MRVVKITLFAILAALLAVGMGTTAYAFHSGGVAECGGCHSMHSPKAGGTSLLVGTDPSSTCLSCHEHAGDTGPSSYHVSTASADLPAGVPPLQRTPGGDFGWLRKAFTFTVRGTVNVVDGSELGHNIIAADQGYSVDPAKATAPGGTFPSNQLSCTSCHDPHGRYRRLSTGAIAVTGAPIKTSGSYNGTGNEPTATEAVGVYRLLAGLGYTKDGVTFTGVPAAKVPSSYNRSETSLTSQTRVAYGVRQGAGEVRWGDWCGTCHPGMHTSGGNYVHPVDQGMSGIVIGFYDTYVKSGDLTGSHASAYSSLTPFATGGTPTYPELAALAGVTTAASAAAAGPVGGSQVMCLSCHRAHASGFEYMLRWQQEYEFITKAGAYGGTDTTANDNSLSRGRTEAENIAAYYDRPATVFATYQRVLCNKCHAKD